MIDIFSYEDFAFPNDFLFGSATAGHQIEGDNKNSGHWEMEIQRHKNDPDYEVSGKACNSYAMWKEDIDLISELGHQVFRMTIEWSRIEPEEGEYSVDELNHYIQIFEALKKRNVKIMLTIVHGTVPVWFDRKGGFGNADNLPIFYRYLEFLIPEICQYVDYYCIFNEFNFSVSEYSSVIKTMHVRAHAKAYQIIKQYSDAPVSTAHAFRQHYAKRQNDPFDLAIQNYYDILFNEFWFHAIRTGEIVFPNQDVFYDKEIKDSCDFWAVNSYVRTIIDTRVKNCEYGERYNFNKIRLIEDKKYDMIQEFNPECFVQNFLRLKDKPVIVTENGLCCDNDEFRIVWITEYLYALKQCMDMGVAVKGYLYWSLLDNYEWGSFKPKFGLVDVDREHGYQRTIKPSGYYYQEIIRNNGFKQEILKKYLQELPRSLYK